MRRGPLYMILASILFTVMVGLAKLARQELGPLEIICWRGLVSVPIAFVFARLNGPIVIKNRRGMLLRSFFGFAAMVCFFTAARGLSMADLSIIGKLQPLVVALLAPLLLGADERSGGTVWSALFIGVAGSALIIGPGLQIGNAYGLWAVAGALFSAAAHVGVRLLGKTDSASAVVFWFQAAILVYSGLGFLAFEGPGFHPPPAHLWPQLLGIGITATAGQLLLTRAYQLERAATVAGAAYTAPVFAALGDWLVFRQVPGSAALVGGSLVLGAGLLLLRQPVVAKDSVIVSGPP